MYPPYEWVAPVLEVYKMYPEVWRPIGSWARKLSVPTEGKIL
ncbi:MAG: hypothetical protein OXT67_08585 [Zetaproteobacteria bacterium]|nr:hypothetical protein [Zetaproteobacteria bacterium]